MNKKINWLIYTVLIGLIPVISRIFICLVTTTDNIMWLNSSDLVAFGLILHISNINAIEHLSDSDKNWKTIQNGTSILFITVYAVMFALSVVAEGIPLFIDSNSIKTCVIILCIVSFLLSYSVYDRITILSQQREAV